MAIYYSWHIQDMKWDSNTGNVVEVDADLVATYQGQVGSAKTTFTEQIKKTLQLNTSLNPDVSIDSLTPGQVKGWLNQAFENELPSIKSELNKTLKQKEKEFIEEEQQKSHNSKTFNYYRPADINSSRTLPNSSWSGEPEIGK